ncbi:MAG: VOC family protein [Thermoanaerobacteraceae bacterium]
MINGLGHIAIKVKDIERSIDFYCNKLGLKEAFRLNDENGQLMLVYIKVAEMQFIELFPNGKDNITDDNLSGFKHICLHVDDIFSTLKELENKGVTIDKQPKMGLDGNYQYWIKDSDGNLIELMQIMPDSLQAKSDM